MPFQSVAIIGAGLSGLSLALFLHQQNIKTTIYELRPDGQRSEGAIMLSPNALRTLNKLGVYSRIESKGFHFRDLTFRNNDHKFLDSYEMGNAKEFGYDALRVYRQVLLDELKAMVSEAGIQIVYDKKFSKVVSGDSSSVTFSFQDGDSITSDLLIGADGIHSTVRKYLAPEISPTFSNIMAITAAIPTSEITFPSSDYPMPVSISGPAGTFVLAPQNPAGSEVLAGIQYRTHDRSQSEWKDLWSNKEDLYKIMTAGYPNFNPTIQSAMTAIGSAKQTLSIWPFYTVPKIPTWSSTASRVVILGDAAHAIPPAAGQSVNQAFEDVHSLSLLIGAVDEGKARWGEALTWWQEYRQARIDRVGNLTMEMNRRREPGWKGDGAGEMDSSWLFGVRIEEDVREFVEGK